VVVEPLAEWGNLAQAVWYYCSEESAEVERWGVDKEVNRQELACSKSLGVAVDSGRKYSEVASAEGGIPA